MTLLEDTLRTVEYLEGASEETLAELRDRGRVAALPAGRTEVRGGRDAGSVVIPLDGEMAEVGRDPEGRAICYEFYGTGETVGIEAAVDHVPQPRDVRVIRAGDFFVVDRDAFARFLDAHPDVRARALAFVGRAFRSQLTERDRLVFLPVHARVARFLLERSCIRRRDGARVLLRETQPEIAIRLGSVREVIAREMASFGRRGLLERTRHGLFVADWDGLWAEALCDRDTDCACAAESAELRTKRFFLPALSWGPSAIADEVSVCCEHLRDVRECVAWKCPLAREAPGACASHHPAHEARPRPARGDPTAQAGGTPSADGARRQSPDAGPASGTSDSHGPRGAVRLHPHADDDTPARSASEEREIRRRIELYRRRASEIESRIGGVTEGPLEATVFREPDTRGD